MGIVGAQAQDRAHRQRGTWMMKFLSLDQFLKMLANHHHPNDDRSRWPQIALLTPEEKLKHKGMLNEGQGQVREMELLIKRAAHIQEEIEIKRDEFWNALYKGHGLPPDGDYHITEDGRILTRPKS